MLLFILWALLQTAETLSSIVIPVVIFALTIGAAYGLSLNGSRTVSIVGALATLYAAVGPLLSDYASMPGWLRTAVIVVGIAATALNERITGGSSKVTVPEARENQKSL